MAETYALPPSLFAAARSFAAGELWRHLKEADLFAVRFPDGRVGYCFVDDAQAEDETPVCRLLLFMEGNAMASYRNVLRVQARAREHMALMMNVIWQMTYLICEFVPAAKLSEKQQAGASAAGYQAEQGLGPIFLKYGTYTDGMMLDNKEDAAYLRHALLAAAYAGKCVQQAAAGARLEAQVEASVSSALDALGFGREDTIPLLTVTPLHREGFDVSSVALPEADRMTIAMPQLDEAAVYGPLCAIAKPQRKAVYCELFALQERDASQASHDKQVGLMILSQDRKPLSVPYVSRFAAEAGALLEGLTEALLAHGKPEMLVVRDTLTALLLTPYAAATGIRLQVRKEVSPLEEIVMRYYVLKMEERNALPDNAAPNNG